MWPFFVYLDCVAIVLGFVTNIALFLAIKNRTALNVRSYGNMVMVCTMEDIFYTIVLALCHQQIQIVDHKLLIISYGIENILPWWPATILSSMEYFFLIEAVTILPAQFYYRYYLMTTTTTSQRTKNFVLFFLVFMSCLITSSIAIFAVACHVKSVRRPKSHYTDLLDPVFWDPETNQTEYAGAVDFEDWEGWLFMGWGGVLITVSYVIMMYYGHQSIKGVTLNVDTQNASAKVQQLRAQFTRNMIAQTINSFLMAVFPMFIVVVLMFSGLNIRSYGVAIMSLVAWTPFTNAAMCLTIIKPYRDYVMGRSKSSSIVKATSIAPVSSAVQKQSKY
ncbi:unnamed protein product [Bursaphelenchus xylophilus]|uniref:(pine wood nematode) hypothetical protein n=1 Tax=Bursaphelenchus xylophilus TaxID=6326 RepID=A0A1I7RZI6_BURXY|nr:unnamed protein product [Bursaphelenchus xylophilus]CAG9111263.1 unnamed protein product [Bursaphelenchus xylophilus]